MDNFTPPFTEFSLQQLPGFPYEAWSTQRDIYTVLEDQYNGTALDATTTDKTTLKKIEKYPIKINPLKGTCEKHASALFGQNLDSLQIGGIPVRILADTSGEKDKKAAKEKGKQVEKAIKDIFMENGGGALFVSNGITSQYLQGCVFVAAWIKEEDRIAIYAPSPREFYGIPKGHDYWSLHKAWIVREIDKETAESYGHEVRPQDTKWWYIEEWTEDRYKISINNIALKDKDGNAIDSDNPFGFIPIVYIPHIRTNKFLGESVITEMVKGIIRELNLRWADAGDAVNDDSHQPIAIRNVRTNLKTLYHNGRPIIDLGSSTGLASGESNPDMITVSLKSASDVMIKLGDSLYDMYRREVNHPAVADGEDSGSQRSSLSLGVKMWPLVAHIELERMFWTVGLMKFSTMLLKMLEEKGYADVTKEHLKLKLKVIWAPVLPIDRKALVDELASRSSNSLGSQQHLMEMTGDIVDVEEELEIIKAEKEAAAELAQKFAPKPAEPGGSVPLKKNSNTPNTPAPKPAAKTK